jgi:hypothetical protein
MRDHLTAFYSFLFAVHDCALHTPDDLLCIVSDTHVPDEYLAIAYSWLYARIDSQMDWKILFYRMNAYAHFDIAVMNNTSVSLFGYYMVPIYHSGDR